MAIRADGSGKPTPAQNADADRWTEMAVTYQAGKATQQGADQEPVIKVPGTGRQPGDPTTADAAERNPNNPQYAGKSWWSGQIGAAYAARDGSYRQILKSLKAAGYTHDGTRSSVQWYWDLMLEDASYTDMDPFEFMSFRAGKGTDKDGTGPGSGPRGGSGPGGYSGPTWGVQLTNEFDARGLVDNALNQYLGRDATPKEREKFWQQLNKREMQNPQVNTPQGVAGAVGSGGFSPELFAQDFAKSRDDFAETEASTKAMTLIENAIQQGTVMG